MKIGLIGSPSRERPLSSICSPAPRSRGALRRRTRRAPPPGSRACPTARWTDSPHLQAAEDDLRHLRGRRPGGHREGASGLGSTQGIQERRRAASRGPGLHREAWARPRPKRDIEDLDTELILAPRGRRRARAPRGTIKNSERGDVREQAILARLKKTSRARQPLRGGAHADETRRSGDSRFSRRNHPALPDLDERRSATDSGVEPLGAELRGPARRTRIGWVSGDRGEWPSSPETSNGRSCRSRLEGAAIHRVLNDCMPCSGSCPSHGGRKVRAWPIRRTRAQDARARALGHRAGFIPRRSERLRRSRGGRGCSPISEPAASSDSRARTNRCGTERSATFGSTWASERATR